MSEYSEFRELEDTIYKTFTVRKFLMPRGDEDEETVGALTSDLVDAHEELREVRDSPLGISPMLAGKIHSIHAAFRRLLITMPPASNRLLFSDIQKLSQGSQREQFFVIGRCTIRVETLEGETSISIPPNTIIEVGGQELPEQFTQNFVSISLPGDVHLTLQKAHFPEDGWPVAQHGYFDGCFDRTDDQDPGEPGESAE